MGLGPATEREGHGEAWGDVGWRTVRLRNHCPGLQRCNIWVKEHKQPRVTGVMDQITEIKGISYQQNML